MIPTLFTIIPAAAGVLCWAAGRLGSLWPRWIALVTLLGECAGGIIWWISPPGKTGTGLWLAEARADWLPGLGVTFHLAIDGISLLLVLLTCLMGAVAVVSSWRGITERVGFFHFNLLFCLTGVIGVFLALDLFLFYFFWEMMLIPMYFIIALWGHERRFFGAVKFFIFTHAGGLLMLAAIISLVFLNGAQTGRYSFDYPDLLHTSLPASIELALFLAFAAAFLVKLPALPFHSWLPDAHTEAPTGGSIILAGLLLKTGAYGMMRFAVPFFPGAADSCAPAGMVLAVAGIIYGAVLAFAQTDLKRLIAYTSISHMGFVLLGIFAWNGLALQGVMLQIVCHGLSTGALFLLAGVLEERTGTREMSRMGGLWRTAPRMGGVGLFFALASLALPGLGNFIAEFLILLGTYSESVTFTAIAASGMAAAVIYALSFVSRTFFGGLREGAHVDDLSTREMAPFALLVLLILWIGIYPQTLVNSTRTSLDTLMQSTKEPLKVRNEIASKEVPEAGKVRKVSTVVREVYRDPR